MTKPRSRIDPRRAITRVAISVGLGVAAYVIAMGRLPGHSASLVGWNVGALCLLALTWAVIIPADARTTRHVAGAEDPGRTLVYVIALLASSSSLVAATILVGESRHVAPELARIVAALCLLAVASSWTMTHTAFTMRYARLYYREDAEGVGGLDLPAKQPPTYFDFAYVAFTIGMCFQVSDICVTSRQIRRAVLLHAVISFAYNTVILAFVLNLVFGVAGYMVDSLRDGRFVIVGSLGEGAQAKTFDGVDKREGQAVAIKRFDVRGAASWKDVDLAEREARVLQSLSYSKLPRYIDRFEEDGALYLVMEKIEGESLAAIRKRGETLAEKDVVRLLRDASDVLDYLHTRTPPVIHRDLKPGNVLRRPDGSFAFVDFGAVRDKLRPEGGSTVVGTFGYMAPEQFQGRALPGSDVYAIGATTVAMLTGKEPEELPHRGLALDVRSALRGRASDRLIAVLEQMLDPDPDQRASRIAPLLSRLDGDAPADRGARARAAPEPRAPGDDRFARRQTRRESRRAARQARRQQRGARRGSPFPLPFVLSILLSLVFMAATLGVSIATQVVVPIVLTVLSLFFARRGLMAAVRAVQDAGHRAVDAMHRTREQMSVGSVGGETRARVDDTTADPRVRVDVPVEEDAVDEDEAAQSHRRRR